MSIDLGDAPVSGGKIGTFDADSVFEQMIADAGGGPKAVVEDIFGVGEDTNPLAHEEGEEASAPIDKVPVHAEPQASAEGGDEEDVQEEGEGEADPQQEQIKALLETMEQQARAELGLVAPEAPAVPEQAPQEAPQQQIGVQSVQITAEDYDAAMESPEGFQRVVDKAIGSAFRSLLPQVYNIALETHANLQMEQQFYDKHPYMRDLPGLAAKAIVQAKQELAKTNPAYTMDHVVAHAGKLVGNIATLRKELKATKHVSVADKTTGRFAPGKGNARPARNAAPGTKRPANTNDVFALMSKGRDDDAMTKAIAEYM